MSSSSIVDSTALSSLSIVDSTALSSSTPSSMRQSLLLLLKRQYSLDQHCLSLSMSMGRSATSRRRQRCRRCHLAASYSATFLTTNHHRCCCTLHTLSDPPHQLCTYVSPLATNREVSTRQKPKSSSDLHEVSVLLSSKWLLWENVFRSFMRVLFICSWSAYLSPLCNLLHALLPFEISLLKFAR